MRRPPRAGDGDAEAVVPMNYREFAILFRVLHKLEAMRAAATTETVQRYLNEDMDESSLAQASLDRSIEGDYLGALILGEAATLKMQEEKPGHT